MKIDHLTFGTPEYVRVTRMAEREAFEKDAAEAWDKRDEMVEDSPTISEKEALYKIIEDVERLNY
ncbi:hypothetical protein AB0R69_19975 (plasmid) [Bacillus pumilus]|uniref:hypothetical protein n=1 Tax=Bacillus pumilus TaxID=1408 RepID=UPI003455DD39